MAAPPFRDGYGLASSRGGGRIWFRRGRPNRNRQSGIVGLMLDTLTTATPVAWLSHLKIAGKRQREAAAELVATGAKVVLNEVA